MVGSRIGRISLAVLVVGMAAVSGCTSLSGPAQVQNANGLASFSGLLSKGDPGVDRRYILQVHGISTLKRDDYRKQLTDQFPKHGYSQVSTTGWLPVPIGDPLQVSGAGLKCAKPNCTFPTFGQYEKDVFSRGSETVTVYSYYWRADLHLIIDGFLQPDVDANSPPEYRFPSTKKSLLNAWLKRTLMDSGFGDAASYLSPLGSLERDGLESTLCLMFADAINTPEAAAVPPGSHCFEGLARMVTAPSMNAVEFDFLSHSLGSRMLYDVLSPSDPIAGGRSPLAVQARSVLLHRTRNFFMAANQLPLLAVADLTVAQAPQEGGPGPMLAARPPQPLASKGLASVLELRQAPVRAPNALGEPTVINPTSSGLTVLAFQDPDDFLGFKASDATPGPAPNAPRILDIVHRNTDQWAFLVADPAAAHDHELVEPNSLRMILCGATADQNGKLTPDQCADAESDRAAAAEGDRSRRSQDHSDPGD